MNALEFNTDDVLVIDAALDLAIKATGKRGAMFMSLSMRVQQHLQALNVGEQPEAEQPQTDKPEASKPAGKQTQKRNAK